jgi:hypothetical protein
MDEPSSAGSSVGTVVSSASIGKCGASGADCSIVRKAVRESRALGSIGRRYHRVGGSVSPSTNAQNTIFYVSARSSVHILDH